MGKNEKCTRRCDFVRQSLVVRDKFIDSYLRRNDSERSNAKKVHVQ